MFLIGLQLNPATIADSASLSGAVPLGAFTLCGISMPAVWATAPISFQASPDGGTTWQNLFDSAGNEIVLTVAAGQMIMMAAYPSYDWRGVNMLKVRSGTAAAPVNQSGGTVVNIVTRPEQI